MSSEVDIRQLAIVRDEAAEATKERRRRSIVSRYLVPAFLLFGFASLVAWASRDALLPPQQVTVESVLASRSTVQSEGTPLFQAAGWIEPRPTPIRVAALSPGVVDRLLVVEDQPVKAGEAVAELIKDDAQLAYQRALANQKLREAELQQTKAATQAAQTRYSQPVHLEAALGEAEAALAEIETEFKNLPYSLRRAEAELEFAEKDHEGKKAAKGAVSGRAVDQAKSAVDAARAMVEELRNRSASLAAQEKALTQRRDALQTQLDLLADETQAKDETQAQLQAATARVEQARVTLAEAKLRLDRMTVRAPIDGRVYQLVAYPGSTLVGGMGPAEGSDGSTVVTLYRPNMLQARVDVRFEDIPKVSLGQPVEINNPALEAPLRGSVLYVSSEADIQKNTLQVKVAMESAPSVLKPEMLVDVTFLAPKVEDALAEVSEEMRLYIPRQLILQSERGPYIWLADQSAGVARQMPVTLGRTIAGNLVEVTGGLTITSRVIASGYENLSDGKRIRVVDGDAHLASGGGPSTGEQHTMKRLHNEGE